MKEVKTWFCQVDAYRDGSIFRNYNEHLNGCNRQTRGCYYVGAKTAKEAREILQKFIKFGSVCVPKYQGDQSEYPKLKYKEIVRTGWRSEEPLQAATAPRK